MNLKTYLSLAAAVLMVAACSDNKKCASSDECPATACTTQTDGDITYAGLLPAADAEGIEYTLVLNYDDDGDVPYVGFGYIKRYMSEGATTYNAVVLRKVKFKIFGDSAATQEEDIDWQTQALEFEVFRADDAKHTWRRIGADQTTEAAALADLKKALGVTP